MKQVVPGEGLARSFESKTGGLGLHEISALVVKEEEVDRLGFDLCMVPLLNIRTLIDHKLAMFWGLFEFLPEDGGEKLLEFRVVRIEENEAGIFEKVVHQMDERAIERHSLLIPDTEEIKNFRLELGVEDLLLDGCEKLFNGVVEFELSDSADVFIPGIAECVRQLDEIVAFIEEPDRCNLFVVMILTFEPEDRNERVLRIRFLQLSNELEGGEGLVNSVQGSGKQSHLLSGHHREAVIIEEKIDVGERLDSTMEISVLQGQNSGEIGAVDAPVCHVSQDSLPVALIPEVSGIELADFVVVRNVIDEKGGEGGAVRGKIFVVNPVHRERTMLNPCFERRKYTPYWRKLQPSSFVLKSSTLTASGDNHSRIFS